MESRRKRSRSQRLKWGCYILLLVVCTVLQTMPGLFQFGAAKPLWLLPLCLAVSAAEGEFAGAIFGAVCGLMWDYTAGRTVGMLALELMVERCQERKAFGKYLHQYANIGDWIGESRLDIEQADRKSVV